VCCSADNDAGAAESEKEARASKRAVVEAKGLDGGDDALDGPLDVERARVKLEAARARLSGPWYEIPAGRVYDSPPDGTEEEDYDALEMAYNQAFCATSATRLERSQRSSRAGGAVSASNHAAAADSTDDGYVHARGTFDVTVWDDTPHLVHLWWTYFIDKSPRQMLTWARAAWRSISRPRCHRPRQLQLHPSKPPRECPSSL